MIAVTMPLTTTKQDFRLMLQNLLIERFQIKLHHETRVLPGYELIVPPGGPKLMKSADPDDPGPPWGTPNSTEKLDSGGFPVLAPGHNQGVAIGPDGVHMRFQNCTIGGPLFRLVHSPVGRINEPCCGQNTVVVGPEVRASLPPENDEGSGLDGVFKALEKQLGLRLVKAKGFPLDTIVIDHVEQVPTDN